MNFLIRNYRKEEDEEEKSARNMATINNKREYMLIKRIIKIKGE